MRRFVPWVAVAGITVAVLIGMFVVAGSPSASWRAGAAAATGEPAVGPPPSRIRIASIGVDAALEDLRLAEDGSLQTPQDFGRAGWYADGSRPGDVGPAVIAGHVDSHEGPAVFFRLTELKPGAKIDVARGDSWVTFTVLAVKRYPKSRFPTDEVYAPTPNPQLRLITCGGAFDRSRRSYADNVVVYAAVA